MSCFPFSVLLKPLSVMHHPLRLVVASDASQGQPQQGKAGFLVSSHDLARVGAVTRIDSKVFALWDHTPVKISQLELLAVVQGLLTFPDLFRGAYIVWWVDNIAASNSA